MVLYLDTSALLKLYLVERHCTEVHALCATADHLALSRIAWAEACAAFARRARNVPGDRPALMDARDVFRREWTGYQIVEVPQPVVEHAGDFAETFALRAYDAVQLASAYELATQLTEPITFACFDAHLNKAADTLGLAVPFAGFS